MRDWHKLLNAVGLIADRRLLPDDVRAWYERTVMVAHRYIGRVHCPNCGFSFQREVGIRLIGRVLVGVYKAIRYGPPEAPDAD